MIKSKDPVDDSESDTESVCSSLSASSSVATLNEKAKVRATFPPFITTKQLYTHFSRHGFDETEIHIQRHTNRQTGKVRGSATVIVSSQQPGTFISYLNDTLILNVHKLKVEPYVKRQKQGKRQKHASKQSLHTTPVILPNVDARSPDFSHSPRLTTDPCRVFVGSGLPPYINEQHIREHFQYFADEIIRVDTIKDKITHIPKGYFFVTLKSQASADMAIQMLHKSFILGEHRVKVERQKSAQPQHSGLVEAPCSPEMDLCSTVQATSLMVDNLNPSIDDDEIRTLVGVPVVAIIKDEINPQRRYIQFHSHNDTNTAKIKLNGKNFLGQSIQANIHKESPPTLAPQYHEESPPPHLAPQYQYHQNLQQPVQQYPYHVVPQAYQYDHQQHAFTPEQRFQERR